MRTQETAEAFSGEENRNIEEEFRRRMPKLAVTAAAILMSCANLPGGYSPFGAAFTAAVPRRYSTAAAVGGVIGCIIEGGFLMSLDELRHIASIIAVAGIRWALGELKSINTAQFYPLFTAFVGVLLTGMVISGTVSSVISYSTIFYALEGAMAGIAAMFFAAASSIYSHSEYGIKLSRQSAASLIITLSVLLIPICQFSIIGISPGIVLLHAAVLTVLQFKKEVGGAVCGIAAGAVTALSGGSIYMAAICPIAALLSGYTAVYGKIFSAAAYAAVCLIGSLASGRFNYIFIAEIIAAGVISCLVPAEFTEKLLTKTGFADTRRAAPGKGDNTAVIKRLEEAADALSGVSSVVEQVSGKLDKINSPEVDTIYRRSVTKVCSGCACLKQCWKKDCETIGLNMEKLTPILKKSGKIRGLDLSNALGRKCIHEAELAGEINSQYGYHIASQSARKRISQVRSVISDQLEGVGMMLTELSEEIGAVDYEDKYSAEQLAVSLSACGYTVDSVQCIKNRNGRLKVNLSLRITNDVDLEKYEIGEFIGEALGCEFSEPKFDGDKDKFNVTLIQRQNYMLSFGGAQHCCDGEKLCGDAYDAFIDGEGNAYMLISDGMGSGGRAAVDGAMACGLLSRLLKAGFSYDGAMKIVNSALLIKSEDESLSTIDSLRLNLYSGRAMFCKAGAAQSYHVRDGVVNRIDIESLPLGILRETDTAQYSFTAEEGDIIVMLSDGVPTDGSMWFENMLKNYDGQSARDFAKYLLEHAVKRRPAGEDDDITVIVGRIIAA